MQPRAAMLILLLLILAAVSAVWLWGRLIPTTAPARLATATMAPRATATARLAAGATPTQAPPPPGYRLAGVAIGDPESFAVIEAPNGSTGLYRLNDDVPGLGQLLRIEAERVVIRGAAGEFELWLAPAATPTPLPARTPQPRAPMRKPSPRRAPGGTVPAPVS